MKNEITKYYNQLANKYDEDRFSNSYGKYVHSQEKKILERYILTNLNQDNLDLGCGTGRFLEYANFGRDISSEMIKVSQRKYPNKDIAVCDAEHLDFEHERFDNIYSFHVFMHLDMNKVTQIISEAHRILKKNGLFIFDIPSQKRRKFTKYTTDGWHGANQATYKMIQSICQNNWNIVDFHGIAFFPIHRIPKGIRPYFTKLDSTLSNSFVKEYSSHLIFILQKK